MITQPFIYSTPDCPTVQFRDAPEMVDLDKEIPKILHGQGWGCGTIFHVQFVSHNRDKLVKMAKFIVTEDTETLSTNEDNVYQPLTRTVNLRKAEMIGDWWPDENAPTVEVEKELVIETPAEPVLKWNPGKQLHQVIQGTRVVFESPEKLHAVRYRDGFDPLSGEPR